MRALFDSTYALLTVDENARPPDREGHAPEEARDRLEFLLETLDAQRGSIIIPTPVLTELIIRGAREISRLLDLLMRMPRVEIAPFDRRDALECGIMLRERWRAGVKRQPDESRPKVKFDHQIVAIARVCGADVIYSDDAGLAALSGSGERKIPVVGVWDLPARPINRQGELSLPDPDEEP